MHDKPHPLAGQPVTYTRTPDGLAGRQIFHPLNVHVLDWLDRIPGHDWRTSRLPQAHHYIARRLGPQDENGEQAEIIPGDDDVLLVLDGEGQVRVVHDSELVAGAGTIRDNRTVDSGSRGIETGQDSQ